MTRGTKIVLAMTGTLLVFVAALFFALYGGDGEDAEGRLAAMLSEGKLPAVSEGLPMLPSPSPFSSEPEPQNSQSENRTAAAGALKNESEEREVRSFTLAAAGSVSVPRAIREAARSRSSFDFSTAFLGFGACLKDTELALCTLETLTDEGQSFDATNAPEAILDTLKTAGFTLVSIASEHMLDRDYTGLDVTLSALSSRGIEAVGVREETEEIPGCMVLLSGIQTAVLGYTYGLDEACPAGEDARKAVPLLSEDEIRRDITHARANGAEAVILLVHWGVKNRDQAPESIRALALRLAEAGADVILGAHSGVVQPCERLKVTRADGRECEAFVCYSLGNLLSDARADENAAGMVLRLPVEYDPVSQLLHFGAYSATPTYIARQEEEGKTIWRLVEADSDAALSALTPLQREAAYRAVSRIRSVFESDPKGEEEQ